MSKQLQNHEKSYYFFKAYKQIWVGTGSDKYKDRQFPKECVIKKGLMLKSRENPNQ
jgi:hypothetical protein